MLEPTESPYKKATHSPSRQLLWELGQLSLNDQNSFYAQLDENAREREAAHMRALAAAAQQHERVRQSAENERERLEIQLRLDRDLQREEELKEIERLRRIKAERELTVASEKLEEVKAAAAAEREAAEKRRAHAIAVEEARLEREKREAEDAQREEESIAKAAEAEAKAKAAALSALKAKAQASSQEATPLTQPPLAQQQNQLQPLPPALAVQQRPQPASQHVRKPHGQDALSSSREAEHQRYLSLHQHLKEFRARLATQAKSIPALKKSMGDSRRSIRKCVGQLTQDKDQNKGPLHEIARLLRTSTELREPSLDATHFLFDPPRDAQDTSFPALTVYLLNIFAKAIISQFINESSVAPLTAEPIGLVGSSIFAQGALRWNGIPFIDIFVAKLHKVCPVLFGIYGPENMVQGKQRLGWRRNEEGGFVTDQAHFDRMTGLGAGFAAMSLRNYDKSKVSDPYPPWHYWRALAAITNTPAVQVTPTHFIVLKAMLVNFEPRLLEFFGDMGKIAMRRAVVEFPNQPGISDSTARRAVVLLADQCAREKKLFL